MWARIGAFVALLAVTGCQASLPDKVALSPEAQNVEMLSDPPNLEVYEPAGEVSTQVIGREVGETFRQAFNALRNQAHAKGASFVMIEDVASHAAWDLSGRTIVSVSGTAFRPK
ncbi:hypothetical protein [Labilithrix luteola]|uniref:hypothetical protein n=1 Tax=Labilithrix luteola TaxID=1391654 RepID=UPI0011BAAA70|nr:hypothetical protein [Labilithrix luteola]